MLRKIFRIVFSVLILGAISTLCQMAPDTIVGKRNPTDNSWTGMVQHGPPGCPLPPPSFTETDLFGTWIGKPGTATFTTLTLYEDHTYKQVYRDPYIGFEYVNDGKSKWHVEYRESCIPLLHLENMQDCDNDLAACDKTQPTKPAPLYLGDPCEGTLLKQKGEVILLITGVPKEWSEKFPRDTLLKYLEPDPDSGSGIFQREEGQ